MRANCREFRRLAFIAIAMWLTGDTFAIDWHSTEHITTIVRAEKEGQAVVQYGVMSERVVYLVISSGKPSSPLVVIVGAKATSAILKLRDSTRSDIPNDAANLIEIHIHPITSPKRQPRAGLCRGRRVAERNRDLEFEGVSEVKCRR